VSGEGKGLLKFHCVPYSKVKQSRKGTIGAGARFSFNSIGHAGGLEDHNVDVFIDRKRFFPFDQDDDDNKI
jgi:hypothetical protein